jgi:hypothetical protein
MNRLLIKGLFLSLSFLAFSVSPSQVEAQRSNNFITAQDIDAEITPRLTHKEAEATITTRKKSVDLMLTEQYLVIQFTDSFLEKISDEIRKEGEDFSASHAGNVILSMVSSGVRTLLDRALALPLQEISEVYYENGRLYIVNNDGVEIFKDLDIDGTDVMEDFSRRDGRRFAAEAERRMI